MAPFQSALALRDELGLTHVLAESRAGLARALREQGDLAGAQVEVEQVLMYLKTGSLDRTEAPMRAYMCCYEVLRTTGDARAYTLLERAHTELQAQAARLDVVSQRLFLEQVPDNLAIVAAWLEHQQSR